MISTREIVVVSGKGGTGKTSLTASLACLASRANLGVVLADLDVDAPDLHLLLPASLRSRYRFTAGSIATIDMSLCSNCQKCRSLCKFDAITRAPIRVDPLLCNGCGVCARFCPVKAIKMSDRESGEWMVSYTDAGPLVHANLAPGATNSGKLVSILREEARGLAREEECEFVFSDGPPGAGCTFISAIAGANLVLFVAEPTAAGLHDLERALALASHFKSRAAAILNKWDLSPEKTATLERSLATKGVPVLGKVRWDEKFDAASIAHRPIVEFDRSGAAEDVESAWTRLAEFARA